MASASSSIGHNLAPNSNHQKATRIVYLTLLSHRCWHPKQKQQEAEIIPESTHRHTLTPTLFLSISEGDSWVYYKTKGTDGKVVAKLRIPAGFSVVVTSEIHSGLIAFNPEGLEHWFETTHDRVMFRIVHKAPVGGLHMDREDTEWTQFLGEALSEIFPAK